VLGVWSDEDAGVRSEDVPIFIFKIPPIVTSIGEKNFLTAMYSCIDPIFKTRLRKRMFRR